jgi:LPXTG-motif cell wall-anchored protein
VTVDFFSQPTQVATATAGTDGGFEATFDIPTSAAPGEHTVEATGVDPAGQPRVLSADIRVIGEGGAGADLPRTGSSSGPPLAAAGVGLVLLGGAALYVARRRRSLRAQA